MSRPLIAAISLLCLSACASTIDGPVQDVTLRTPGAQNAECFFDNGTTVYRMVTDETRTIVKSPEDLKIHCYAPGNRQKELVVERVVNPLTTLNVINGLVPGVAYDHLSNGLYEYPPVITVDFTTEIAKAYPPPMYHCDDLQDPAAQGIEFMGPGTPMVTSDRGASVIGIRKRDESELLSSNPFSDFYYQPMMSPAPVASAPVPVTPGDGATADEMTRALNPDVFSQ